MGYSNPSYRRLAPTPTDAGTHLPPPEGWKADRVTLFYIRI